MGLGVFAGVFEEMWCLHVVFCGQYVVRSAVSLVSGPVLFRGWKFGTFSGFIFDDSRFGNEPQGVGLQVGWNVCTGWVYNGGAARLSRSLMRRSLWDAGEESATFYVEYKGGMYRTDQGDRHMS